MDDQRATRFAEQWYTAWNAHDLEAVLEHYTDDVEMTSPLVAALVGHADGRIAGKAELREVFAAGLERYPHLPFAPPSLLAGVARPLLHQTRVGGRVAAAPVFLAE